jgi:hypothetical protein
LFLLWLLRVLRLLQPHLPLHLLIVITYQSLRIQNFPNYNHTHLRQLQRTHEIIPFDLFYNANYKHD